MDKDLRDFFIVWAVTLAASSRALLQSVHLCQPYRLVAAFVTLQDYSSLTTVRAQWRWPEESSFC